MHYTIGANTMFSKLSRRSASLALALAASATLSACTESTGPDDHDEEPEIAAVTVTSSAGGTATLPLNGSQSGTVTLRANQANTLTINVLGVNGSPDPVIVEHSNEFEIRLVQGGTVRFTSSNATHPYVMTATPTAVGTAAYELQVYAKEHAHVEYSRPLTVTVIQ